MPAGIAFVLKAPANAGGGLKNGVVSAGVKHPLKAFNIDEFGAFPLRAHLSELGGVCGCAVKTRVSDNKKHIAVKGEAAKRSHRGRFFFKENRPALAGITADFDSVKKVIYPKRSVGRVNH